jgi:hypothetical protein
MGLDWITTCAPAWQRTWDRGLQKLACPNLFPPEIPDIERTFRARPSGESRFEAGQQVLLQLEGDEVGIYLGTSRIGVATSPPPAMVAQIRESGQGVACGTVTQVHQYSGSADISVL